MNIRSMVLVGPIIGAVALAGLLYAALPPSPSIDQPEDDVLESLAEEKAENAIVGLANNVHEVKALTDSGYRANTDVVEKNATHVVTQSLLQKGIVITGDYKTGYTLTFPGTQEVTSVIEDSKIVSTSVTKPHDLKQTETYTEEEIRIIDAGTSVPIIKEYLAQHDGDPNVLVGLVPVTSGMIVAVQNFETGEILRTLVNPETNQVLKVFEIIKS